ncbi:MAG TPA: hypothetical protein VJ547_05660 [Candidatus Thermoplasmatota archaeon]|nr:hypothetical protein [Candidatus Thermoplasmatota archaeon]
MDLAKAVAGALASAHACGACGETFVDGELRDFAGVPVCVDDYRALELLTLLELPAEPDFALLDRLLSVPPGGGAPAGPRRRFSALWKFASRYAPGGAESLLSTAARGTPGTGMPEVLWVLLAAVALLRAGGSNGTRPLEGRELSLLLNLGARVGMDVAWASMLDTGIAKRALDEVGAEWAYEDLVAPAGTDIARLAAEKAAFARYIRGLKVKVDILVKEAQGHRDDTDIPLELIARTADEILAAFSMMEGPHGGGPKKAS